MAKGTGKDVPAIMSERPRQRPAQTLRSVDALVAAGLVPASRRSALDAVAKRYTVALTPDVVAQMDPSDPTDPIARQYVPDEAELRTTPDERSDPIGDDAHSPVKGVVHRYPDRVLLKPILVCPVYCRFCFRREVVGHGKSLSEAEIEAALDYVRAHPEIYEVILTGGDPLMLAPRRLASLIRAIEAIPHVSVIRVHSRVPVADPARISPALVKALAAKKALYLAIHCNHPRELGEAAKAACLKLGKAGIALFGQTVLLKGINDQAETLDGLFRAMLAARIKPYYLHQADLAPGTSHFRTTIEEGQALMRALRGRLTGLALPTYVLDIPDGYGKVPVGPEYLSSGPGGPKELRDPRGEIHPYPPPKPYVAR